MTKQSDILGLRLARLGGAALSNEDYDMIHGDDTDGGDYDPARALRQLLRALGEEIANPTDGELALIAAKKIAELRNSNGNSRNRKPANPLIPDGLDGEKIEPVAMSVTDPTPAEADRIAMSLVEKMGVAAERSAGDDDMDEFTRLCSQYGR